MTKTYYSKRFDCEVTYRIEKADKNDWAGDDIAIEMEMTDLIENNFTDLIDEIRFKL